MVVPWGRMLQRFHGALCKSAPYNHKEERQDDNKDILHATWDFITEYFSEYMWWWTTCQDYAKKGLSINRACSFCASKRTLFLDHLADFVVGDLWVVQVIKELMISVSWSTPCLILQYKCLCNWYCQLLSAACTGVKRDFKKPLGI